MRERTTAQHPTGLRAYGRRSLNMRSSLVRRGTIWALLDQGLLSACNFATLVVLAHALLPSRFGAFVLAYTTLLFFTGLQTGLVTQPHNVLAQGLEEAHYQSYTESTATAQLLFTAASVGLLTIAALSAFS